MIVTTRGAFFFFVSWMARPRPTGGPAYHRVVQCDAASRDSYFPFDSYPSRSRARLRYFIGVPTRLSPSSTPRATLLFSSLCAKTVLCALSSPLFCSTSPPRVFVVFRFFEKKTTRGGDLLNCRLKSSTFPSTSYVLRSYTGLRQW